MPNFKTLSLLSILFALVSCKEQVQFSDEDDFSINARSCSTSEDYFTQKVLPVIAQCSACHFDHDGSNELKIKNGDQYNNYLNMRNYILDGFEQVLLDKPSGDNDVFHTGGIRFDVQSDEYANLNEFIALVHTDEESSCDQLNQSASVDVNIESFDQTLRKSTLLFAGRLPTSVEYAKVVSASSLRRVLKDNVMKGENFEKFLMESANDRLLTNKFNGRTSVQGYYYPLRDVLYDENLGGDGSNETRDLIDLSLKQMPLRLINYVVKNDLPYSEVLTADYIIVNGYSGPGLMGDDFKGEVRQFDNWQKGDITKYRFIMDEYSETNFSLPDHVLSKTDEGKKRLPQAGLLTSPVFLYRYQSTDTGRNRARANQTLQMFLGVDLEGSIVRAQDPEELTNFTNPGDPASSCFGCHKVMDPIAGTFQSYGDEGEYLHKENGTTTLSNSYIREGKRGSNQSNPLRYHTKDTWYRDNLIPAGFESENMNKDEEFWYQSLQDQEKYVDATQWLANKIVKDERFLTGTVKFWYPVIFGTDPINAPVNTSDANYSERAQIYEYQQNLIKDLASDFRFRKLNLKDLLVDMVLSDQYRALDRKDINTNTEFVAGQGVLLTPEQLDRKIYAVTQLGWNNLSNSESNRKLLSDYYFYYGGIDSDEIEKRTSEITSLMGLVIERMTGEFSCRMLMEDFVLPQGERRLMRFVELSYVPQTQPENASGVYKVDINNIRHQIARLHFDILGEDLDDDDPEVDQTLALFTAVWNMRMNDENYSDNPSQNSEDPIYNEYCNTGGRQWDTSVWPYKNPEQTLKSWQAVIIYLMSDFKFIYR
ncbi:hypothetical protein [Marinicellulosiphila megalodicopiae]|uniref:hypothetical protein n=1 Tax=Marinicellulosiphila megalodicopiae TaxID=2724896 RepID=UPI003BAFF877